MFKKLNENLEIYLSTFFLIIFSILTIVQVIMRYIFHNSLSWSEEIARFAFVFFVYISASYAVKRRSHVKFSLFVDKLPRKLGIICKYLALLLWFSFLVISGYYSLKVMAHLVQTMQLAPSTQLPMYLFYVAIPIGLVLMTIRVIQHLVMSTKELKQLLR